MPQHFYHLKFELYPYPYSPDSPASPAAGPFPSRTRTKTRTREQEEDLKREIWLPPSSSNGGEEGKEAIDIFNSASWPNHKPVISTTTAQQQQHTKRTNPSLGSKYPIHANNNDNDNLPRRSSVHNTSIGTGVSAGGGVIDCGPSRAPPPSTHDEHRQQQVTSSTDTGFPPPQPGNIRASLRVARRDWRFARVRVESWDPKVTLTSSSPRRGTDTGGQVGDFSASSARDVDLDVDVEENVKEVDMDRATGIGRSRGESSARLNAGLTAAAAAAAAVAGGRVTKSRFEEGKNTELGWGVVHLYRDGEDGVGGTGTDVEIYNSAASSRTTGGGQEVPAGGGQKQGKEEEEEEDFTTLCIPAVPSYLTPSDFLGFVGERTREAVSHFRMVMTGRMNRYLVLMKFRDGGEARRWKKEWDGKVFNSMEPETCHVTFIKSITFQTPTSTSLSTTSFPELAHDPFTPYLKPFPPPTPKLVELPTCPVCLERMDDTTGLLTILCQHVFHCACLQKWRGSGCPVCRHTNPSPAATSLSGYTSEPPFGANPTNLCNVCDSSTDLWICLICGLVGCGRYKGGHAKEHWKESAHNFALEIETQHVWDYAGDLWVHRLIRDKGNGKVVEFPRGGGMGEEDRGGMEMVPREKLDTIGMEYTHLLTSQLESQRVYFEELVSKAASKASSASSSAALATDKAEEALARLRLVEEENRKLKDDVIIALEKDVARERRRAEKSGEVARGFGRSLMEEKKVSEGLLARVEHVNKGMADLGAELARVRDENAELKDENRDLLFSITAGEKLKDMQNAEQGGLEAGELEGGTLALPPEKPSSRGKGKGKTKK